LKSVAQHPWLMGLVEQILLRALANGRSGRRDHREKNVRLQVAATQREESGQGIARMPKSAFAARYCRRRWDTGKRSTPAIAVPAYPEDQALDVGSTAFQR
jgi:transitional endoplasmic reticulum ATPase